ncbi:FAD-dependent oxidoreductase [Actinomadura violacea]|uniref:FAD-dependent oxidoreductase n=1 Tax=Actinomadura violacea TaxID=2819934 RepID=A0ABS3S2L6_9ACTN|nr:FAD-dependent oxidoreductase [Actinomadura violacea]MBO2463246.1 FAD-dependent oxidoreductase [Actinomadura violacea]
MGSVYKAVAVHDRPFWRERDGHAEFVVLGEPGAAVFDTSPPDGLSMPSEPVGDVHWAGTETAGEHAGYIEGAIESGERAAREVVESLAGARRKERP